MEQWSLQFYRGLGVALTLFTFLLLDARRNVVTKFLSMGRTGLYAALCFSAGSTLFLSSLYLTSVANTLVLISSAPIFGVILSRIFLGESLPVRTWVAALLAMASVALIVVFSHSGEDQRGFWGDVLALLQAVFMAGTFVLVRRSRHVSMVPCMALSGVITACVALPLAGSLAPQVSHIPLLVVLCLFILPVSFGMLMVAPQYLSAPEVNMIMLLEMIFGPLFVWSLLGEAVPGPTVWGGTALFLILSGYFSLSLWENRSSETPR